VPLSRAGQKNERLRGCEAVTIVLGLKTPQGLILAADTQESYEKSHKVNRPKLVYKADKNLCDLPIGLAVAGAGIGPWIDKLTAGIWMAVQDATSLDEACEKAEGDIKEHYREFKELLSYDPHSELIYGIGASGTTRLFHSYGPIVNEVDVSTSGSGQSIADFLLRRFKSTMHITNAIAIAVYVLYCAKLHADGCGGDSHLAVLQNDGQSYLLDATHVATMERVLEKTSSITDIFLMLAGNPISTAQHIQAMGEFLAQNISMQLEQFSGLDSIPELLARLEKLRMGEIKQ